MKEACETCQYWRPGEYNKEQGSCRINPPTPNRFGSATWPVTKWDDFCGSYKKKKQ